MSDEQEVKVAMYEVARESEERIVRAMAAMMAQGSPYEGFVGIRGSGCAGSAEWMIEPKKAETEEEYAERLAKAGLDALKGPLA